MLTKKHTKAFMLTWSRSALVDYIGALYKEIRELENHVDMLMAKQRAAERESVVKWSD